MQMGSQTIDTTLKIRKKTPKIAFPLTLILGDAIISLDEIRYYFISTQKPMISLT